MGGHPCAEVLQAALKGVVIDARGLEAMLEKIACDMI